MKVASKLGLMLVLGLVSFSCTKKNPSLCCVDEADCNAVGLSEVKLCEAGLACVENQCILQSCETTSCSAEIPVCNASTNVCEGCADSSQCAPFPDTDVCDTASGGCVDCVAPSDCPAATPVCDANACRACKLDSECASGACGDDGMCVDEILIVYLDPGGTDSGTCDRSSPCRQLGFGISRTSPTRNHIVMATGGYVGNLVVTPQSTSASRVSLHGGGATVSTTSTETTTLRTSLPMNIKNLKFAGMMGADALILEGGAMFYLENIDIEGAQSGIGTYAPATLNNVTIANCIQGIFVGAGGTLTADRVTIRGGMKGIYASTAGTNVTITNALIFGTTELALDLTNANGTVAFSTIADSGSDAGTGPRAVNCSSSITVRSSIVWAPGTTTRVPLQGCNLASTIAGPTSVPGAMNVDPQFVNAANRDYHLAPNSPARDAVETGPTTDFEGDPRPRGARFDIGADEAAP